MTEERLKELADMAADCGDFSVMERAIYELSDEIRRLRWGIDSILSDDNNEHDYDCDYRRNRGGCDCWEDRLYKLRHGSQ